MKTLTKIQKIIFVLAVALSFLGVASGGSIYSLSQYGTHPCHPELDKQPGSEQPGQPLSAKDLAACQSCNIKDPSSGQLQKCLNDNPIIDDLRTVIKVLSAGVGIVIVGMIIWGGIQYSLAGNNPNAVSSAKGHITNAIIALLAFFFIFALLNFLIPGGELIQL